MGGDSLSKMAADVRARRVSAGELCADTLRRIETCDPRVRAFLQVCAGPATEQAAAVDVALSRGEQIGPLAGVPIALKDNICTSFERTTCASRMLENFRAPYDATVVEKLGAAGAVIVGKTNLDEFAMGGSTENSALRLTLNPWDTSCVPGGSSGGSAVAVATSMTPAALGSDTGGSIRQPAAFCGVVGLKPTYGRVSRFGLVAFGSSLDQIGPITRSVDDAALLLAVIAGHDPRDTTSAPAPPPEFATALADPALLDAARGLRIGVPREFFGDGLETQTCAAVEQALQVYRKLGAQVIEISLPHAPLCVAAYYLIATAEASSNLARFDGVRYGRRAADGRSIQELYSRSRAEGFGAEVKRRIMLGTFALSAGYHDAYFEKALRVRRLIHDDFVRAFEQVDIIAGPVSPAPAWPLGAKSSDPLQMYLADLYTIPANLAGLPAICVPCGFTAEGLPIGLQLHAASMQEAILLQAARLYERETDWVNARRPVVSAL